MRSTTQKYYPHGLLLTILVSSETSDDNQFIVLSDIINFLTQVCTENLGSNFQSNFESKTKKSDTYLTKRKILTKNNVKERDLKHDLKNSIVEKLKLRCNLGL